MDNEGFIIWVDNEGFDKEECSQSWDLSSGILEILEKKEILENKRFLKRRIRKKENELEFSFEEKVKYLQFYVL